MTLTLKDPGELIATIPLMLGFMPVDSVVVVGLTRTGAMQPVLRTDAAEFAVADAARSVARVVAAHLSRSGASRAVVVGFDHHTRWGSAASVVAARQALAVHVDVVDAWAVSHGRYRSPECVDPRCCPDVGRVLPSPPAHIAQAFAARPHHSVESARAPADRRRKAQRAHDRCWAARTRNPETWRQQRLQAWRRALHQMATGAEPTDAEIGKLAAGLRDVGVRDAIVIDLVPGEGRVAEALCTDASAPGVKEALAVMLVPATAVAPQPATVEALERLVHHLAWLCPRDRAPAMTVLGLMRWWHGDESGAAHAIALALATDPRHRLAELVQCAIDAHLPPGWLTAA